MSFSPVIWSNSTKCPKIYEIIEIFYLNFVENLNLIQLNQYFSKFIWYLLSFSAVVWSNSTKCPKMYEIIEMFY